MASSPVKCDGRQPRVSSKEGQPASPESSLTWCLAHLYKPGSPGGAEHQTGSCRDGDKRSKMCQWRALLAIRTQHIKGDKAGIARFRGKGGLRLLLNLLQHPDCSRKTLDLALSILANCCTEPETRLEVRKLEGINVVVDIMKRNVALETVQNRAARALGNLAMDPESSALIHSAGGIPPLLLCLSLSSAPSSPTAAPPSDSCPKLECAQSAARALLYLSDSPSNRLSLLTQGTLSALAPLIAPEYPHGLRRAALRTLHELTRGCGVECAREVSRSGVLTQLGVMASGESGEHFEELALKTLANVCSQGCLRPLVGSLGVIQKFAEEVKRDPLKSGVFLKALCLCCKEAVNRAKVKESGGLEVLMKFLSSHQSHPLSRFAILACVDFVFDESAMEKLQELGLVPVLVALLVKLTRGEEHAMEKADVSVSCGAAHSELLSSSCLDSFDFPPPEGFRREEAGREQGSSSFLSLRSWLLSEGLISSEGELLESSCAEAESSSPQTSSPTSDASQSPNTPSSSSSVSRKTTPPMSPVSSSSSSSWSVADSPSSSGTASSAVCSPSSTPQTPISPSKLSSSQKRRRLHSAASSAKIALDSPPAVPRTAAYHHPYHPEPWTPESPILLLLSRFSHAGDPSAALVSSGVMSGLLCYLTQHQDPSSRCFRMLCRLSCNPSCLQALVRTGSVALIRHRLCSSEDASERRPRQTGRVKAKLRQLGDALLNNLRVQCESGFGSGVLTHVMLSGSESDKMNCALSLPFISSNKSLLRKLLLDCGGLLAALRPLHCVNEEEEDGGDEEHRGRLLSDLFNSPHSDGTAQPFALYCSLLLACLSALTGSVKPKPVERSQTRSVGGGRDSPPPWKRPRLADSCPYGSATFDLVLLLDDGTRLPANREAVAGAEGAGGVGSEYFRALLRGGFGEARGGAEEAIPIGDVSAGMLLPLLHYLHGCRFGSGRRRCRTLDAAVLDGLAVFQTGTEELTAEGFQKNPLCELMMGACRFLVNDLQSELEDISVSFLLSSRPQQAARKDDADKKVRKSPDPAEDSLASEPELTAQARKLDFLQQVEGGETLREVLTGLDRGLDESTIRKVLSVPKPAPEEEPSGPKSLLEEAGLDSCSPSDAALAALLPRLYWFSQRYAYPALGRACLARLAGFQDCPRPFASSSSSVAAGCLRRLAREADCTESLKQDLLSLVSAALG
ncbi:armadillo repeat-containing protein 5 [Fundulus heteroclitus]|uniref:armadillo repeat-containing protein 5 n=1 Tax=Fundulus heteroclitus TaxID=8078 RepID=UPI00165A8B9C|nr:armadillo repeat-containing protein 5 [Fundulus heteroclitus]